MADDLSPPTTPPTPPAGDAPSGDGSEPLSIATELRDSYLNYAMSVIISRALPDVRDGLKPSQRRILVAMNDLGLGPSSSTSKCAGIVGETMKRYHPHGEQTIYPTLVRMAQEWNMRYRLVEPQGNFGSIAGLPQAAMRYCVTGETLVRTPTGTRRIDELAKVEPNSEAELSTNVLNRDGANVPVSKLFHSGDHPTYRLKTREGFEVTGTANHPLLCLESVGGVPQHRWKLLADLRPDDVVVIARGAATPTETALSGEERQKALLAGAMVAEGFFSKRRAGFNNTDKRYFDLVLAAYDSVVGGPRYLAKRRIASGNLLFELDVHNTEALRRSCLAELEGLPSDEKKVPSFVWSGSLAQKRVFLQALFEGDGSSSLLPRKTMSLSYSTRSDRLAREVQLLLLEFGVVARRANYDSGEIKLFVSNRRDARLFANRVGFLVTKQEKLDRELEQIPQSSSALSRDFVPFLADYIRKHNESRSAEKNWLQLHNVDRIERWDRDGELILGKIESDSVKRHVAELLAPGYYYSRVDSVVEAGVQPVYSIRVENECHSFLANGFVNHNTEARLDQRAAEMLADLNHDTVDFIDNYDGKYREPMVLPSRFPNLLVNGSDGIAVGMATDIPPHNLREVCNALIRVIDDPEVTIQQLLEEQIIQGPDFPTGGIILGRSGIVEGYTTGRTTANKRIKLRARAEINEEGRTPQIIVTEVPYQVTRNKLSQSIADLVKNDRIKGITGIRDESSQRRGEPVRLVIELRRDADPHIVLNQLYKFSPMEKTVSVILLAIVDGKPRELTLKQILQEYVRHRAQVIRRRTEYLLREAKRRSHILEGQLIAISSLDEVIRICRSSPSRVQAKIDLQGLEVSAALMARALGDEHFAALQRELGERDSYNMTEVQADAVVRLQLGQLAALERDEILKEFQELRKKIGEYETLLSSESNILDVVKKDLVEIRDKYGDDRRTDIEGEWAEVDDESLIPEEQQAVTISHNGYIKRLNINTYRSQHRGGKGVSGSSTRDEDFIEHFFTASTHDYLLCFTNRGQLYWLRVFNIPEQSRTARGRSIAQVLTLREDEKITSVINVRSFEGDRYLLMGTKRGIVKKTALDAYKRPKRGGIIGINLDDDDTLIDVVLVEPTDEVVLSTKKGMAIRFDEADARAMGRNTRGVKGINLQEDDEVVGLVVSDPEGFLLTICANGYGKRTPFGANTAGGAQTAEQEDDAPSEGESDSDEASTSSSSGMSYRTQKRGGKGLIDIKTTERNGPVIGTLRVREKDDIMLITTSGMVNRTHVREIRVIGRNTQGVRVMNLKEGDSVASVACVAHEEDAPSEDADGHVEANGTAVEPTAPSPDEGDATSNGESPTTES